MIEEEEKEKEKEKAKKRKRRKQEKAEKEETEQTPSVRLRPISTSANFDFGAQRNRQACSALKERCFLTLRDFALACWAQNDLVFGSPTPSDNCQHHQTGPTPKTHQFGVRSLRLLAASRTAPSLFAIMWSTVAMHGTYQDGQPVGTPIRGNPSTTTSKRRLSVARTGRSKSRIMQFVPTRRQASGQKRAALTSANPLLPKTPALAHATRWWPNEAIRFFPPEDAESNMSHVNQIGQTNRPNQERRPPRPLLHLLAKRLTNQRTRGCTRWTKCGSICDAIQER